MVLFSKFLPKSTLGGKMNIVILFLFLIAGAAAGAIWVVQEWDQIDRALCTRTPWYFRLWWCALWVRKDEFHPSLDTDAGAILEKQLFYCSILKLKMDVFRLKPWYLMTQAECTEEAKKLSELRDKISEEHYSSLAHRRAIAHERSIESPSQ